MRQHAGTTTKILCRSAVARSWGVRLKKVLLRIFRTFLKQPVRADRPGVIPVIAEPLVPKAQKKAGMAAEVHMPALFRYRSVRRMSLALVMLRREAEESGPLS